MHRLPAAICLALSLCAAAGFAANAEAIDEADLYDVQVMTWTPPDAKTFPPEELMDKASVLAGLVDYHERDFGGSGYDSGAGTLVLYVSSERGEELAKEAGLSEDPDIRLERVARSSAESWEILDAFANRVELQAGLVMANLSNDGQSFEFAVQKEPSGADAAALAELPGRVSVRTGLGPASRSSSDSDVSPFAGGSRFMTADEIVVTVPPRTTWNKPARVATHTRGTSTNSC